jgi:hypothetical protein
MTVSCVSPGSPDKAVAVDSVFIEIISRHPAFNRTVIESYPGDEYPQKYL